MKLEYTDREGRTYTLDNPTRADVPRFIRAVRADTKTVVVVHDSGVRVAVADLEPKPKE